MASINKKLIIREAKHYGIMLLGVSILSFGLFNIHSQSKITEGGILGFTLLLSRTGSEYLREFLLYVLTQRAICRT